MLKNKGTAQKARRKITEALAVLGDLGFPREQRNERSALTLLALLDLTPARPWAGASRPLRGITEMMDYFREHFGKKYAPNTRETVRRFTIHQFVQAGLVRLNPDQPSRPTNSPLTRYQITPRALRLLRSFGARNWRRNLRAYLAGAGTLAERYAQERRMNLLPVLLPPGQRISLSPGGQNVLVKQVIEEFCPRFTPGGRPLYVGDTGKKWAYLDEPALARLGVKLERHGKMPDVIIQHRRKGWLVLIEAVAGHGPVTPKRRRELAELFGAARAGLVFVSAFLSRRAMLRYLHQIAWGTEVWVAETPSHLIHFNGERFLGPYAKK